MAWGEAGGSWQYFAAKNHTAKIQSDYRGGVNFSKAIGAANLSSEGGWFAMSTADAVYLSRFDNNTPRFPGDRRQPQPPPGTPVKEEAVPENAPWDWVAKLAWEDGPGKGPAGGLLYFPYSGNLAKLKTIELIYNGPEGLVTLPLRGSALSPAKSAEPARKP